MKPIYLVRARRLHSQLNDSVRLFTSLKSAKLHQFRCLSLYGYDECVVYRTTSLWSTGELDYEVVSYVKA